MNRILISLATCWLISLPAGAEVYKCRLPDGKTEISNQPCPSGSGTVVVRPDDTVPEASRQQAERDVERMRNYVERRENAQRADVIADKQQQNQRQNSAVAPSRQYGDPDACLRDVASKALEATQRAQLEAECQNLVRPASLQPPVYGPVYGYPAPIHPPLPPKPPQAQPAPAPTGPSMVLCAPGKPCQR